MDLPNEVRKIQSGSQVNIKPLTDEVAAFLLRSVASLLDKASNEKGDIREADESAAYNIKL